MVPRESPFCLLILSAKQIIILMINICFAPEPSGANVKKICLLRLHVEQTYVLLVFAHEPS